MKKIAISCQGGGTQAAFTAGVLRSFFGAGIHHHREIVSLSGTSGGGICAALAWYGLLKQAAGDPVPIPQRILRFWQEVAVQATAKLPVDDDIADLLRITDQGMVRHFEMNSADPMTRALVGVLTSFVPRIESTDLKRLLQKYIRFEELKDLVGPASPVLLVGASDVLKGNLKTFNSLKEEICVEAILASAEVPKVFAEARVGDHYYWDRLFADNPPVQELIRARTVEGHRIPDEIWVIQTNATTSKSIPTTPADIVERRNQMVGNIALMQNLELIKLVNFLLGEQAPSRELLVRYGITRQDPIDVHFIKMSQDLSDSLDYASKLNRDPDVISTLMDEGEKQGSEFVEQYLTETEHAVGFVDQREPVVAHAAR